VPKPAVVAVAVAVVAMAAAAHVTTHVATHVTTQDGGQSGTAKAATSTAPSGQQLHPVGIQGGQSDNDIKSFLVARYGAFVLMKPPVRDDTFFLWFGPAMLILIGVGVIGVTISRSRRRLGNDEESDLNLDVPEST